MISTTVTFVCIMCLLAPATLVSSSCSPPDPTYPIRVKETNGRDAGTLFSMKAPTAALELEVSPLAGPTRDNFKKYFSLAKTSGDTWSLSLRQPIDLDTELSTPRNHEGGLDLQVTILCTDGSNETIVYNRKLLVTAVDEYYPVFVQDVVYNIREDVLFNESVANLHKLVSDRDYNDSKTPYRFYLEYDKKAPRDISDVFIMHENGSLYLNRKLDYEIGDRQFNLKVRALNSKNQKVGAVVQFKVINVNDNPVEFVYSDCVGSCTDSHYAVEVDLGFAGLLTDVKYGPVYARDLDADPIEYSIVGGSPIDYDQYLTINKSTGEVTLMKPIENLRVGLMDITIRAKSLSTLPLGRGMKPEDDDFTYMLVFVSGRTFNFIPINEYLMVNDAPKHLKRPIFLMGSWVVYFAVLTYWCRSEM